MSSFQFKSILRQSSHKNKKEKRKEIDNGKIESQDVDNHNKSDTVVIKSDLMLASKESKLPLSNEEWIIHEQQYNYVNKTGRKSVRYPSGPQKPKLNLINDSIPISNADNIEIEEETLSPSLQFKSYINKLKCDDISYKFQEIIAMINNLLLTFENAFQITNHVLKNYFNMNDITNITHVIFEYICNDFLIEIPFLRIKLCKEIKKLLHIEEIEEEIENEIKQQIKLIDSIIESSFDVRFKYYSTIDIHINLATFFWNDNKFEKACFYVSKSLKNCCNITDIRKAKLNYMLAHIYQFHIGKYKLSKKHYQIAIKQNKSHGKSLFEYAYLLEKKFNNISNAIKYYKKHIELIENMSNNVVEYDIDIGTPRLSVFIGNSTPSFTSRESLIFKPIHSHAITKSIEITKEEMDNYNVYDKLKNEFHEYKKSVQSMHSVSDLKIHKKKLAKKSRIRLAEIYEKNNDNKNAKIQYEILLDYDSKYFIGLLRYANLLQYNLDDYINAEIYYKKAIKIYSKYNNSNNRIKGIEMFVKYCELLVTDGISRKDEVFLLIENALNIIIDKLHNKLMLRFGEILCDNSDELIYIDKAIECFKFILKNNNRNNNNNNYNVYLELGRIYNYNKNNYVISYDYFKKALLLNHLKNDWHLHFEIAMLMSDKNFKYENIKRPFQIAKDHAQKSLNFCKDNEDKNELIKIYKSIQLIVYF